MALLTTTDGRFSVESNLTDREAANACNRIPASNRDSQFARKLAADLNRFGSLFANKRVWLHRLAVAQIARETRAALAAVPPAAPVTTPAPVAPEAAPETPPAAPPTPAAPPAAPVVTPYPEDEDGEIDLNGMYSLGYDIPDTVQIDNPTGILRPRAVRLRLSEWIIRGRDIPWMYVNRLRRAGAIVDIIPQHPKAEQKLLKMSVRAMRKELEQKLKNAEKSMKDEAAKYDAPDGDPNKKRDAYLKAAERIQQRIDEMTGDYRTACRNFLMNADEVFPLRETERKALGFRASMMEKAGLYAAAAELLRSMNTDDTKAMAAAMERDEVPADIAADMIEDNGGDASALRAAFSDANFGD